MVHSEATLAYSLSFIIVFIKKKEKKKRETRVIKIGYIS